MSVDGTVRYGLQLDLIRSDMHAGGMADKDDRELTTARILSGGAMLPEEVESKWDRNYEMGDASAVLD